jgi:hypothetical protein
MDTTMTLQEPKIIAEYVSEDSDNFSERFSQIIRAALNRSDAAEAFFGFYAQNAFDRYCSSFCQQLADKKALHRRVIEKIGLNSELLPFPADCCVSNYGDPVVAPGDPSAFQEGGPAVHMQNIFEIVYEKALDELNFYLNFLLIERHPVISSLLLSLANLSKDFLFEAKLRYLEYQSKINMGNSEKIIAHFLMLEQRSN